MITLKNGARYTLPDGTEVRAVAWSTGTFDGFRLDDLATGEPLYNFDRHNGGAVRYAYQPAEDAYRALPCDLQPDDLRRIPT